MSRNDTSRRERGSMFHVSGWPLRRKLALALAVPLVLAATLGGLRVQSDLTEAANLSSSADQVTVLRPAIRYLTVAERAMVAAQPGSGGTQAQLDTAVTDLKSAADSLGEARRSADLTPEQDHQVDVVLDLSRALREGSTDTLSPGTWVAQLRQLQSGVTQLIGTIVSAQIDPEPRLELLSQTLGGRFSLAMQQALVATDRSGDTGSLELFSELGVEGAAIDRLASALGDSESAIAALRTDNAQRTRTVRTGGTDLGGSAAYTEYDGLVSTLLDGIDDQLSGSAADARTRAVVNAAITLAALLAALLLAFLVSRLLLTPIRKVREGALAAAQVQLPEAVARIRAGEEPEEIAPIPVTTHEEMGQMARAVDDMHRQAVLLAAGEAGLRAQVGEMFVTLSRRNTSLINQQLSLIETLEKDEEDPRRLDSLFRLDHLASRMRRTADSLLILADAPAPTSGLEDLTVADSLHAATSGVQDYQRVHVGATSSARLTEAAAADVVHLLTELVDNALTYSPPTSTVEIGSITGSNGVTIDVSDRGLGIPVTSLETINTTLRDGAEVTPATARRMGLFVVSRLAQRHGIAVSLRRNEHGGTTATVFLPSPILSTTAGTARPPAPRPATAPSPAEPDAATAPPAAAPPAAAPPAAAPAAAAPGVTPPPTGSIADRINGALGLPNRRPGTSLDPAMSPMAPLFAVGPAPTAEADEVGDAQPVDAEPVHSQPVDAEPVDSEPVDTEPVDADEVDADDARPADDEVPDDRAPVEPVPSVAPLHPSPAPVAVVATPSVPPAGVSGPAAVAEPVVAEPTPVTLRAVPDALDGPATTSDADGEADTPIFRAMQSAWLSADGGEQPWRTSEVEAGWDRADTVAETGSSQQVSAAGLPVRRPGTRLVPGGVSKPATSVARDPEAIRKRLAAHAQGVARGRTAAATNPHTPQTEAGPA